MWVELKKFAFICHDMFPYNDEENAWISKQNVKVEKNKHSLIYSLLFAFCAALFSTTISPIIYFYRINLFN